MNRILSIIHELRIKRAERRLLAADGRLVAIIPASAKGKDVLPGFSHEWHGPYDNQFAGTIVSVVILVAERAR